MLKTFALRGREAPLSLYAPAGSRSWSARCGACSPAHVPYEIVELGPGDTLHARRYEMRVFAVRHGSAAVGYALVEHERPGRFDVEAADVSGVPPPLRAGFSAARRSRSRTGGPSPRLPCSARPAPGARSS
jgi:ribonuclease Z